MEGESEPAAAAAVFSAVLDNDDLLGEILIRVAFPTSLVRAALVCKRWLCLASEPGFLRRISDLHPLSLLGFYVVTKCHAPAEDNKPPQFVPLPQHPELAAVVRRASFNLDLHSDWFDLDCLNGLVLIFHGHGHPEVMVRCPLHPATYKTILPPLPNTSIHDGFTHYYHDILPSGNGGGELDMSYFCSALGSKEQRLVWDVYVLQGDIWAIMSSVVIEIEDFALVFINLISHDKIYNLALVSDAYMLVSLDLTSSCLSLVSLPEEVEYRRTHMSLANDSGVHLIHIKGSHLRIWLYTTDKDGLANWFLVDTICLREICVDQMISTRMFEDVGNPAAFTVHAVGVDSGFLFLESDDVRYLFDIKRKEAKKVYEVTQEDRYLYGVTPFMMVWPPKFPVMKEGCDPKE